MAGSVCSTLGGPVSLHSQLELWEKAGVGVGLLTTRNLLCLRSRRHVSRESDASSFFPHFPSRDVQWEQWRRHVATMAAGRGFGGQQGKSSSASKCPCEGGRYKDCCGRFHGGALEPDALSLMRMKETMVKGLILVSETCDFFKLEIKDVENGSHKNETFVEFKASYRHTKADKRYITVMHEKSRFVREGRQWLYIEAIFADAHSKEEGTVDVQSKPKLP